MSEHDTAKVIDLVQVLLNQRFGNKSASGTSELNDIQTRAKVLNWYVRGGVASYSTSRCANCATRNIVDA